MLRQMILLSLLGGLPGLAGAAEPVAPVCQSGGQEVAPFEPIDAQPLTHEQARGVRLFFDRVDGSWSGRMTETVCMQSGEVRRRGHTAELVVKEIRGGLQVSGETVQDAGGAKRRFSRRLLLAGGRLHVDRASAAGEVQLDHADRRELSYRQRFRTTHELTQPPQGKAGQPATGSIGGDTSAVVVAGGTDVVSTTVTPQPQPKPVRRSLMREERFTVTKSSARHLQMRQDFYTQGAYTGTKLWDLRKR